MSKRAGPPLFELLRERGQSAEPPPETARKPDPSIPWTGAGVTRAERSAAALDDEPRPSGEVRVSNTKIYLAVAVALALIVGAWAAGYRVGFGAGKAEMTRLVSDEPVVTPPRSLGTNQGTPGGSQPQANNPAGSNPSGSGPGTAPQTKPPTQTPPNASTQPPPSGAWVLLADGLKAADPRIPDTNYLELATLPPDQAQDALAFLGSKGVRAVGVPVDSGGRDANNPTRYTLYSLGLAVPSGQYRTTTTERREHQQLVASIGSQWMRERQGGSDFSQTLWRKYTP